LFPGDRGGVYIDGIGHSWGISISSSNIIVVVVVSAHHDLLPFLLLEPFNQPPTAAMHDIVINNEVHNRRRRRGSAHYQDDDNDEHYYHPRDVLYYEDGREVVSSDWRVRDALLNDPGKRLAMRAAPVRYIERDEGARVLVEYGEYRAAKKRRASAAAAAEHRAYVEALREEYRQLQEQRHRLDGPKKLYTVVRTTTTEREPDYVEYVAPREKHVKFLLPAETREPPPRLLEYKTTEYRDYVPVRKYAVR
jgi:hypothetical protein